MTQKDREKILNHPRIKNHVTQLDIHRLMEEIHPYIQEKDWAIVRKKIEGCLSHNSNLAIPQALKPRKAGLLDLLKGERVRMIPKADSWIKALWEAGEPLLKAGSIEERYIDTIISQLQYYGPYMFITPGVILAHAKPEDGVMRLDASMTILRKPVIFTDFHKASVIIILAASDQESHLKILRDIAELFSIQARVDDLISLPDGDSVIKYLEKLPLFDA